MSHKIKLAVADPSDLGNKLHIKNGFECLENEDITAIILKFKNVLSGQ